MLKSKSKLLTQAEVAKMLGVSRVTVERLRWSGSLRFYKLAGGAVRISLEHLEEFLQRSERNAPQAQLPPAA